MANKTQRDNKPKYHLLNMRRVKYGDSILIQAGGKTILVDGGKPGDQDDDDDEGPSIPNQLYEILGSPSPYDLDLLIVTHCHQDHIGCLPRLIKDGTIRCKVALVADEKLGFPGSFLKSAPPQIRALIAALAEEGYEDLQGAELNEYVAAGAKLVDNYVEMLQMLEDSGTTVVRYRQETATDRSKVDQIVSAFSATGFAVLGPTWKHLSICADQLELTIKDAVKLFAGEVNASLSVPELYRRLMTKRAHDFAAVRKRLGDALNCQSIVVAFGQPGQRVLLPGDMQFAEPGVSGLDGEMKALSQAVADHGPYTFLKLPHHTSDNGISEKLLESFGWPPLLGHSGGYNDAKHPKPDILEMLESLSETRSFWFARTDRNGIISVDPSGGAAQNFEIETGSLNNFTVNVEEASLFERYKRVAPAVVGPPLVARKRGVTAATTFGAAGAILVALPGVLGPLFDIWPRILSAVIGAVFIGLAMRTRHE